MMIILMTIRLIKQDNLTSLSDKCWQNYTTIKSNFGPYKNDHFKDVSQNFMSTFQIPNLAMGRRVVEFPNM